MIMNDDSPGSKKAWTTETLSLSWLQLGEGFAPEMGQCPTCAPPGFIQNVD